MPEELRQLPAYKLCSAILHIVLLSPSSTRYSCNCSNEPKLRTKGQSANAAGLANHVARLHLHPLFVQGFSPRPGCLQQALATRGEVSLVLVSLCSVLFASQQVGSEKSSISLSYGRLLKKYFPMPVIFHCRPKHFSRIAVWGDRGK